MQKASYWKQLHIINNLISKLYEIYRNNFPIKFNKINLNDFNNFGNDFRWNKKYYNIYNESIF